MHLEILLLCPDGQEMNANSGGTGPVDAVCKAIDKITKIDVELTEFSVSAVTEGIDSIGEVTIRIEKDSSIYSGRGSDTDIVVASAKAYVNAINRFISIIDQSKKTVI